MELEESLEYTVKKLKSKGLDRFDLIAGDSTDIGLEVYKGRIQNTEASNSRGVGVRLFQNEKPGYSYSERLDASALDQMIEDALAQTEFTARLPVDLPKPISLEEKELESFSQELETIDFQWMQERGRELEKISWDFSDKIENIPSVYLGKGESTTLIANSNGVFHSKKSNVLSCGLAVVASEKESKKMGSYSRSGRNLDWFALGDIGKEAVERAVSLLHAEPVESGEYPVLLSNRVTPRLFSMFSSPYFAEVGQKGQSRLYDKLGKKIASSILTLECNPHLVGWPGSKLMDSEGVPTIPKTVIQSGILQTHLHNLESAKKAGVDPTGNAARSYGGKVGTAFTNLVVPLGQKTREELLSAYPKCILVESLEGGSGCSAVSGEISIGIQGFLYENGKRIRPVDRITMNSNYFELLQLIEGISDTYSDSYSSVKIPDLLVSKVSVAG